MKALVAPKPPEAPSKRYRVTIEGTPVGHIEMVSSLTEAAEVAAQLLLFRAEARRVTASESRGTFIAEGKVGWIKGECPPIPFQVTEVDDDARI